VISSFTSSIAFTTSILLIILITKLLLHVTIKLVNSNIVSDFLSQISQFDLFVKVSNCNICWKYHW